MKFVIYTNILTPYRRHFYDLLFDECKLQGDEFTVLVMTENEPNRSWHYNELKTEYTVLLKGCTFARGEAYYHFNSNLISTLKTIVPDVVVCAGGYNCPGVYIAAMMATKIGYKCLFWNETHLNEHKNTGYFKKVIRDGIRKMVYKKFYGFWYSGKLSKDLCELYAKSDANYYFLPNTVDERIYFRKDRKNDEGISYLRGKYSISNDRVVFFCPARLSPVKGIIEFLELISKSSLIGKVQIVIAGDGELKNTITDTATKYNIDVKLLGLRTQQEINELYNAADVFLLPSLSDPNPLTCIEALWEGLPLFISEHCGNYPEVIIQGENGYSFNYVEKGKAIQKFENLILAEMQWKENAAVISQGIAMKKYDSSATVKRIMADMRCLSER